MALKPLSFVSIISAKKYNCKVTLHTIELTQLLNQNRLKEKSRNLKGKDNGR